MKDLKDFTIMAGKTKYNMLLDSSASKELASWFYDFYEHKTRYKSVIKKVQKIAGDENFAEFDDKIFLLK